MSKGDQWFSGDGKGCGEDWQGEIIIKGHKWTFGGDGYVCYLFGGNDFSVVFIFYNI